MRVLAADLGLHVGLALIEPNCRPRVLQFDIPVPARCLGKVARCFVSKMVPIIDKVKPDHIVRATRFIARNSQPVAIGPVYGLSMRLDELADERGIDYFEVAESDARKAFLGRVPRKSKEIKNAIRAECVQRNYPVLNEHSCDAIVVGEHALSIIDPSYAVSSTPLFGRA